MLDKIFTQKFLIFFQKQVGLGTSQKTDPDLRNF